MPFYNSWYGASAWKWFYSGAPNPAGNDPRILHDRKGETKMAAPKDPVKKQIWLGRMSARNKKNAEKKLVEKMSTVVQPEGKFKYIPLTKGLVAIVSSEDFEKISKYNWCAAWDPSTRSFRAMRAERKEDGKYQTVFMHREILNLSRIDKVEGDHINHDTLDNRKENLRKATVEESKQNRRKSTNNGSGFKGVYKGSKNRWTAEISCNEKQIRLGSFKSPEEAHEAYKKKAKELFGEFACFE